MQNIRFWAPAQHGIWDAVLQRETSNADEVFHHLPQMYKDDYRSFWHHQISRNSHPCHFCQTELLTIMQNIRFWAPSQHGEWTAILWRTTSIATEMCYNFSQMYKRYYDSYSIYKHLVTNTVSFLPKLTLKFHAKHQILGTLLAPVIEWCSVKRAIRCCVGVTNPYLDVSGRFKDLSAASIHPSLSTLVLYCKKQLSTIM